MYFSLPLPKIIKNKTHLYWIWLSLVQLSVQASRTGLDGSSLPPPPLSQKHSGSRHKSLQRWCRHLKPRESINPVDQTQNAKTDDVFFFTYLFFFLASHNNKALLQYGDRMQEMFSYWLKFWACHGSKLTAGWHLTFLKSVTAKTENWICEPVSPTL